MKSAYLLAGTRFTKLFRIFKRHGMGISFKFFIRFLFLLQNGIWASIFYRKERKLFCKRIKAQQLPADPIFIIGHWRTGSTYLHQLLALDEQFATCNLFQSSIPDSFLSSRKSYEPIMSKVLKGNRPMDQVKLGMDEPQEDEYALFRMSTHSPLEDLIFPKDKAYFLKPYSDFIPKNEEDLQEWKNALMLFYKKIMIAGGDNKKLLMKNPFHSMRIPLLKELFPQARFIVIDRNPEVLIPSTIRMWDIVGRQNAMNRQWKTPEFVEVVKFYKRLREKMKEDLTDIPISRKISIQFDRLEAEPVSVVKRIYEHFQLPYNNNFDQSLRGFIQSNRGYKKNTYQLSKKQVQILKHELQEL